MLPDIPVTKDEIRKALLVRIRNRAAELWPILGIVKAVTQHEGGKNFQYEQEGGAIVADEYKLISAKLEIEFDEVPLLQGERLQKKIDYIAEQIAGEASRLFYEKLDEVTTATGNVVKTDGTITEEHFLQMLDRIEMTFDDEGEPSGMFMLVPAGSNLFERAQQWSQNEDFERRRREIVDRKREKWAQREAGRKLAD